MNKLFINYFVTLMVMLGTSFGALANTIDHIIKTKELDLCAHPHQMPFSKEDRSSNSALGFQIDVARALADKLDVTLNVSWVMSKRNVKKTDCDFYAGVAKLPGRESKYVKISDAYYRMTFVVATLTSTPVIENIQQLKNLTVGVSPGSVASRALQANKIGKAVRFPNEHSRLQALYDGKIDAAVVTSLSANWFAKEKAIKLHLNDAESVLEITTNYDYALGLRKADDKTLSTFNTLLQQMTVDGTLRQLFKKYGVQL
ncbi:MAG: transporter substrate-binding domain-containing protein [Colwellia sp.]|nr:transporter substrate-binding domain-containing protein [Colwellia sp.]